MYILSCRRWCKDKRKASAQLVEVWEVKQDCRQLMLNQRAAVDPSPSDAGAHALASILDAVAPNAITSALLLVAGLLLVFDVHAGLDVLVLPVLAALAGGVTSAWLLLTKITE